MAARRAPRGADVADHLSAPDLLSLADVEAREMTEARRDPEAVVDDDRLAVVAVVFGGLDRAVGRRPDRRAERSRDVEAGVIIRLTRERVRPPAERRGQVSGDGPARRRG